MSLCSLQRAAKRPQKLPIYVSPTANSGVIMAVPWHKNRDSEHLTPVGEVAVNQSEWFAIGLVYVFIGYYRFLVGFPIGF